MRSMEMRKVWMERRSGRRLVKDQEMNEMKKNKGAVIGIGMGWFAVARCDTLGTIRRGY